MEQHMMEKEEVETLRVTEISLDAEKWTVQSKTNRSGFKLSLTGIKQVEENKYNQLQTN